MVLSMMTNISMAVLFVVAPAPAEATVSVTDAAILGGVIGAIIVILLAVLAAMKLTRGTAEKSPTTPPTFTSAAEPPI